MHICGEIQYKIDGTGENVHSDVCLEYEDFYVSVDRVDNDGETYRKFLHQVLDEWLDRSGGTGHFAIGDFNEF